MSTLVFAVPLVLYDVWCRGRVLPVTLWGFGVSSGYHVLAMVLVGMGAAGAMARWITG